MGAFSCRGSFEDTDGFLIYRTLYSAGASLQSVTKLMPGFNMYVNELGLCLYINIDLASGFPWLLYLYDKLAQEVELICIKPWHIAENEDGSNKEDIRKALGETRCNMEVR